MAKAKEPRPKAFIEALPEPRRSEIRELDALIRKTAPKLEPFVLSGTLGYGRYRYRGSSGREGEWFRIGLASNEASISLHVMAAEAGRYLVEAYADRLPKAEIGRACVRFKKVQDVDVRVLRDLVRKGSKLPPMGELEG
ncbi:MAG TPA: DUF1801 domain-containing protein [Actinomycetota bacterium]|nr:DUF1801 domain-containing protein [Actinomycetota bacterium]